MSHHVRGSIFLVTMALLAVMVVLAYGFIRSIGIASAGARSLDLAGLAQSAARTGLAHACGVIADDFPRHPGVPTTLNGLYRTAFLPIDTSMVGKETATTNDDAPFGADGSTSELNDNDSPTENLLTELYAINSNGKGVYKARGTLFLGARLMHPGGGRYIEVGRYNRDLRNRPISFHLTHPTGPDPANADPALHDLGEPWTPDLDAPFLLDTALQRGADADRAHYRLRYAVAVEDLSGHLLVSCQGSYQGGAASAATAATPVDADQAKVIEIDTATAQRYADSFTNMMLATAGVRPYWAWSAFQGLGAKPGASSGSVKSDADYGLLRHFAAGIPHIAVDYDPAAPTPVGEPDWRYQTEITPTVSPIHLGLQGASYSFAGPQTPNNADERRCLAYLWTPFGHAGDASLPVTDWRGNPSGVPWRLNLPTAAPQAIASMLFGYVPQEFRSLRYIFRNIYDFGGVDADGATIWNLNSKTILSPAVRGYFPTVNLFTAPSAFASRFAHLGSQPYPGSAPDTPGADWSADLGAQINVNSLGGEAAYCRSPLWGQGGLYGTTGRPGSYLLMLDDSITEKQEAYPGGQQWILSMSSGATQRLIQGDGYWYGDSYWLDMAAAFAHACAVAQLAWQGDNGAGWIGDKTAGRALYPATWADPEYAAYAGAPMLDLDVDGDGALDTPALFRSIADVDRQFVKNLGEWPEDQPTASRPITPHIGLYVVKGPEVTATAVTKAILPSNNIRSLLAAAKITMGSAALMELAVNDMRMSFFGASPQYPDFTPIDFDGDGSARCSAYATGSAAADPATGHGPSPPAADRFSLTGCFVMQQSRYYRIFVRGEVYDTLRRLPAARADVESVFCVDPDGKIYDGINNLLPSASQPLETRILFQRWLQNKYQGHQIRDQQ